jgi:hypothetical protein
MNEINDVTEKNEMNERMKSMKEGRKEHFRPRIHTLPESFASRDGVDMVNTTSPPTRRQTPLFPTTVRPPANWPGHRPAQKNTSYMYPTLISH